MALTKWKRHGADAERQFCRDLAGLFLGTAIVAALLFGGCRKSTEVDSQWVDKPMLADGAVSDWSGLAATRLEDKETSIILANDSVNLYLLVRFRNAMWARLIHHSGITFQFTSQGEDEDYFMLRFKGGPSAAELRKLGGERERPDRDTLSRDMRPQIMPPLVDTASDQLICEVKDRIVEKLVPVDGAQGPSAASGISDGLVTYEFRIPLSESKVMFYGLNARPGESMTIKATWGEMDFERPKEGGPRFGLDGGGPPGGGGMPGGGGGMRGGPPGGPGNRQMPEKQEYTIKTVLALSAVMTTSEK